MPNAPALADVEVTSTVDLTSQINRRLVEAERRVWDSFRVQIVNYIKNQWVGWKYEGRPPGAPRNVSRTRWSSRIETTEAAATMIIFNQARSWNSGRPYVAYVKRSKGSPEEWAVLFDAVKVQYLPPMREALLAEVLKGVFLPSAPKKLRARGGGATERVRL